MSAVGFGKDVDNAYKYSDISKMRTVCSVESQTPHLYYNECVTNSHFICLYYPKGRLSIKMGNPNTTPDIQLITID